MSTGETILRQDRRHVVSNETRFESVQGARCCS